MDGTSAQVVSLFRHARLGTPTVAWICAIAASCYWQELDLVGFAISLAVTVTYVYTLRPWDVDQQGIELAMGASAPQNPRTLFGPKHYLAFLEAATSFAPPTLSARGQYKQEKCEQIWAAQPEQPDARKKMMEQKMDESAVAPRAVTPTSLNCVTPGVFNMIQPDASDEEAAKIGCELHRLAAEAEVQVQGEKGASGDVRSTLRVFRMHGCRDMTGRGMLAIAGGLLKHQSTLEVLSMRDCELDKVGGGLRIGELLASCSSLKELDVTGGGITATGAKAIGRAIAASTSLEVLRLSGNQIALGGAAAIAGGLEKSPSLAFLSLANTGIGPASIIALSSCIARNRTLVHLDLSECNLIGDQGAGRLGSILYDIESLESLNLSGCGIGPGGAAHIGEGLCENASVMELDMSRCKIGSAGACHISACFDVHGNRLRVLKLSNCDIGPRGAEAIGHSDGFADNPNGPHLRHSGLWHLDLSLNVIENQGALAIAKGLAATSSCTHLVLQRCGIRKAGTSAIGKAMEFNTSLRSLNIADNMIGDAEAAWIAHSFSKSRSLVLLDLSRGGIGEVGAETIGRALMSNTTLTDLRLDGNKIKDLGARWIAEGLERSASLRHLHIYNCGIRAPGMMEIGCALGVNTTLEVLGAGGRTFKYGPAKREAMRVFGVAIKNSRRVGMLSGLALEGLYLCDAWSELGLPRECSAWSNERIIKKWACDKEKLVAFGMGMHPRLGGAQKSAADHAWDWPSLNIRTPSRPRHNGKSSVIYGMMKDDVFKLVCSHVLDSSLDGSHHCCLRDVGHHPSVLG